MEWWKITLELRVWKNHDVVFLSRGCLHIFCIFGLLRRTTLFSPNMAKVWPEALGNPWGFHGFWVARCVEAHKSREGHKAASREARQYGPALCAGLPTTLALPRPQ